MILQDGGKRMKKTTEVNWKGGSPNGWTKSDWCQNSSVAVRISLQDRSPRNRRENSSYSVNGKEECVYCSKCVDGNDDSSNDDSNDDDDGNDDSSNDGSNDDDDGGVDKAINESIEQGNFHFFVGWGWKRVGWSEWESARVAVERCRKREN